MLKERHGVSHLELFRQAVLGYIGQSTLGSMFQMRDMGFSLSTREYYNYIHDAPILIFKDKFYVAGMQCAIFIAHK